MPYLRSVSSFPTYIFLPIAYFGDILAVEVCVCLYRRGRLELEQPVNLVGELGDDEDVHVGHAEVFATFTFISGMKVSISPRRYLSRCILHKKS